jgi:hypothetical protein
MSNIKLFESKKFIPIEMILRKRRTSYHHQKSAKSGKTMILPPVKFFI